MRIVLVGYGKMGKSLERIALKRGHEVAAIVRDTRYIKNLVGTSFDVALEFTNPQSAYTNIKTLLEKKIAVVSGTTGWNDNLADAIALSRSSEVPFFYASNFSIGMNMAFFMTRKVSQLLADHEGLDISIDEIHHLEKLDSPSGTAITLADGIIANTKNKSWVNEPSEEEDVLPIISKREKGVVGTHSVDYRLTDETLRIEHVAHDRSIFALGAILAAEYIHGKKGYWTMEDLLDIKKEA